MLAPRRTAEPLHITVVADLPSAASEIARALRQHGHTVGWSLLGGQARPSQPAVADHQAVLLRTGPQSAERALEFATSAPAVQRPLVLLTPSGSPGLSELARRAGALIHLLEPTSTQALVAALHVAVARGGDLRHLRAELAAARNAHHSRLLVERAKAVLMARFGLTEEAAHRLLQTESRSRSRTLTETAHHVIGSASLRRSSL
ncbi:MAG: ANTAR domain-containing response regulator [Armatimonadota bacterium]